MRKGLMIGLVTLATGLLGGSGWVAYQEFAKRQQVEAMRPHVKAATLQASGYLTAIGQQNTTFSEVFKKGEQLLERVDRSVIDLRSLSGATPLPQEKVALDYLTSLQLLARDLPRYYRARMQTTAAQKAADRAHAEIAGGNSYVVQAALKNMSESLEEAKRELAVAVEAEKSISALLPALEAQAAAVAHAFGPEVRLPAEQIKALAKEHGP